MQLLIRTLFTLSIYSLQCFTKEFDQFIFEHHAAFEMQKELRAKLGSLSRQFFVLQGLYRWFKCIYFIYKRLNSLQISFVGVAHDFPK